MRCPKCDNEMKRSDVLDAMWCQNCGNMEEDTIAIQLTKDEVFRLEQALDIMQAMYPDPDQEGIANKAALREEIRKTEELQKKMSRYG